MLLAALLACLVLVAACSGDDDVDSGPTDTATGSIPDAVPTFTGEITNVAVFEPVTEDCIDPETLDPDSSVSDDDPPICSDPATSPAGRILVEAVPGEQAGDKISLRIDPDTPLLRDTETGAVTIDFDDLAEGDDVDVWVSGPVAESYPLQGTADVVVVRP